MNPTMVGIFAFACTFGSTLLGMRLRSALPAHHLDDGSKDTVKVCIGFIATMTALVLGLVTASAKSSFDAVDSAVKNTAHEILSLDRVLARYGPETRQMRANFQRAIGIRIDMIWPQGSSGRVPVDPLRSGAMSEAEKLPDEIRALKPRDESQQALRSRALDLVEELLQARWLVLAGGETSVPLLFLATLVFWLTIIFAGFGLFAPRNATVVAVLFVCAVSVGSAVFLVWEMDTPFDGVLKVSASPLQYALAHLNQ